METLKSLPLNHFYETVRKVYNQNIFCYFKDIAISIFFKGS